MTSAEILYTPFLDLLFENRNKGYGAYNLRKNYNQRLAAALSVSLAAGLTVALLFFTKNEKARIGSLLPDEVTVSTVDIVPPKAPDQPKPPTEKPIKGMTQQQFTPPRITAHPVTEVPAQPDLASVSISNQTVEGLPADAPVLAAAVESPEPAPEAKPEAPANSEPQFAGGAAAWALFLGRNLQAPEPLEEGEKKTVVVKFLVSEDGTVTAFQVVQSGGAAFDAEVIRVLKKMPKWRPARRGGQPVATPFTQPVTFVAIGE